jgi:hypothetical protein
MSDIVVELPKRILYMDECIAVVSKKIGEICENNAADLKLSLIENMRNDLETLAIQMLSKVEVETSLINSVTQILDKQIDNGLVIKQKTRNTNS